MVTKGGSIHQVVQLYDFHKPKFLSLFGDLHGKTEPTVMPSLAKGEHYKGSKGLRI
jgi:hypothetical protein